MIEACKYEPPPQSVFERLGVIDPLFAVAINVGLAEAFIGYKFFKHWRWPTTEEAVQALGFVAVVWIVIDSWIGYRKSIQKKPIESGNRFAVSIILVILYTLMLVRHANMDAVLLMFIAMFALYTVWDLFKAREKKAASGVAVARGYFKTCRISAGWLGAALVLALLYRFIGSSLNTLLAHVLALVGVVMISRAYRIHKKWPETPVARWLGRAGASASS